MGRSALRFQPQQDLACGAGEEPAAVNGLLEGIAVAAHLHQQRAVGEVLIVDRAADGNGPGQGGVEGVHALLDLHGQGQVLVPVGVVAPLGAAQHQHDLRGGLAVDGGQGLVNRAVLPNQGVPVDVQDDFDGGVLLQVLLDSLLGAGVGSVVVGVVVGGLVVDHREAHLLKDRLHLVADADHVAVGVQGAAVVGLLVDVGAVGGVSLGGVGVHDEDLGFLGVPQGDVHRRGGQGGRVHGELGAVEDVHAVGIGVPVGRGGD